MCRSSSEHSENINTLPTKINNTENLPDYRIKLSVPKIEEGLAGFTATSTPRSPNDSFYANSYTSRSKRNNKTCLYQACKSKQLDELKSKNQPKFLQYDTSLGWEPLCEFINKQVPLCQFPKSASNWNTDAKDYKNGLIDELHYKLNLILLALCLHLFILFRNCTSFLILTLILFCWILHQSYERYFNKLEILSNFYLENKDKILSLIMFWKKPDPETQEDSEGEEDNFTFSLPKSPMLSMRRRR